MGNGLGQASPIIGRSLKYFESPRDQIETFQDDIEYDASLLLIGSPSLVDYDKSDSIITPPHLKRINISMEMYSAFDNKMVTLYKKFYGAYGLDNAKYSPIFLQSWLLYSVMTTDANAPKINLKKQVQEYVNVKALPRFVFKTKCFWNFSTNKGVDELDTLKLGALNDHFSLFNSMVINDVAGVSIPVTRDVFEKLLSSPFSDDTNIFRCVGSSKDSIVIGPCCLLGNSSYVKSSDVLKSSMIKELETDDDIVVEELSVANFLRRVSLKKNSAFYVLKDRRQIAVETAAIQVVPSNQDSKIPVDTIFGKVDELEAVDDQVPESKNVEETKNLEHKEDESDDDEKDQESNSDAGSEGELEDAEEDEEDHEKEHEEELASENEEENEEEDDDENDQEGDSDAGLEGELEDAEEDEEDHEEELVSENEKEDEEEESHEKDHESENAAEKSDSENEEEDALVMSAVEEEAGIKRKVPSDFEIRLENALKKCKTSLRSRIKPYRNPYN